MKDSSLAKPVERLFPFVLRSRILLVGKETLARSKSRLHFVLVTDDVSEVGREEILAEFAHYPVVRHFTMAELEKHFGIRGARVVGFAKSHLAQSIYAELKQYRLNKPPGTPTAPPVDLPKAEGSAPGNQDQAERPIKG